MRIPSRRHDFILGGEVQMNLSFVSVRRAAGICLAVLLFLVCTAGAQRGTSGSIEGALTDVQGGAISGAKLTAVNSDTGDRKSTRLNSSHQIISYAVFCLKKKK